MVKLSAACVFFAFAASVGAAPASPSVSAAESEATVAFASDDPNYTLWNENSTNTPEAIRGSLGTTVIGPQNVPIDLENPNLLAPPTTDAGTIGNAKWPMGLSHNRLQTGGWARQQNEAVMSMATEMAGVNMRLEVGAIRELHWHKTDEWAYILKGSVQVSAIDQNGANYLGTVSAGDLWYFPAGIPHSLQATADDPDGSEFLLVFDDGAFSEDATFLLTDWLAHTPKEVIAKNFQTDISAFDHIPAEQLYIFPGVAPSDDAQAPVSPQGTVPQPYTFKMSQLPATQLSGGTVKVVDSRTFPVSVNTAVAEVTVEPGAMRELHWHPTQDEWDYFIGGNARITLFGSTGNARTFDYQPGDVGYIPASYGHYVENTGNTTLHFLEIFKTNIYQDISLSQWLALTPPALVKAHLNISDELIASLSRSKQVVVGPVASSS
ncbi:oxalate decarboxylase [Neolentinus lepideus HHB14362 ss-1]|uniref:Oxalate decarboxylase n=1 Tax=Neolentinus lepideus HHB14362 ss-1 TaxID=1314782 RepID=A0A165VK42_9AGAM|nr:oxalate decarboxylase [Neolentinus lepideus HHB14362 ss-1]